MKRLNCRLNWTVLLLLTITASGCQTAPPELITDYEAVELTRNEYVKVDAELVEPVSEVPLPDDFMTMPSGQAVVAVGEAYKLCNVEIRQCNLQLDKISKLKVEDEPDH